MNTCESCANFQICAIRKQRDRLFRTGGASLSERGHKAIREAVCAACVKYESLPDVERINALRDRLVDESRYGVKPRGGSNERG